MSHRLSTRIGLPAPEESARGLDDVIRFREPTAGSEVRTKGSLFLLAQVTGDDAALGRAAGDALEALERDYYYDLSSGPLGALSKALAGANRRIYHQRSRLGIPRHRPASAGIRRRRPGESRQAPAPRPSHLVAAA